MQVDGHAWERSPERSWTMCIMKILCINFKIFYTKINTFYSHFPAHFLEYPPTAYTQTSQRTPTVCLFHIFPPQLRLKSSSPHREPWQSRGIFVFADNTADTASSRNWAKQRSGEMEKTGTVEEPWAGQVPHRIRLHTGCSPRATPAGGGCANCSFGWSECTRVLLESRTLRGLLERHKLSGRLLNTSVQCDARNKH